MFATNDPLDVVLQRVEPLGEHLRLARLLPELHDDDLRSFWRPSVRLRHIVPLDSRSVARTWTCDTGPTLRSTRWFHVAGGPDVVGTRRRPARRFDASRGP
jgi:hypothetical protein